MEVINTDIQAFIGEKEFFSRMPGEILKLFLFSLDHLRPEPQEPWHSILVLPESAP